MVDTIYEIRPLNQQNSDFSDVSLTSSNADILSHFHNQSIETIAQFVQDFFSIPKSETKETLNQINLDNFSYLRENYSFLFYLFFLVILFFLLRSLYYQYVLWNSESRKMNFLNRKKAE